MRTTYFALLLIASTVICNAQTTIRVANNNPGAPLGTHVYTSLQEAIDSSQAGDIIQVTASPVNYGDISIDRQLTILGVGFNPSKAVGTLSEVSDINFVDGAASGTRISGLTTSNGIIITHTGSFSLNNIVIENCRFGRVFHSTTAGTSIGNMIIRNNIIDGDGSTADSRCIYFGSVNASGILITNNILMSPWGNMVRGTGLTFEHNTFVGDNSDATFGPIHNCIFRKNIFYGCQYQLLDNNSYTGNSFIDNLGGGSYGTDSTFASGFHGNTASNNIAQADPLFTNFNFENVWSGTMDLTPTIGSPAIVNTQDRTEDIGITGGATPFNAEGTLLPLIENIIAPSVVKQGDDLQVRIQASSN